LPVSPGKEKLFLCALCGSVVKQFWGLLSSAKISAPVKKSHDSLGVIPIVNLATFAAVY
jgi:hypothetical protein